MRFLSANMWFVNMDVEIEKTRKLLVFKYTLISMWIALKIDWSILIQRLYTFFLYCENDKIKNLKLFLLENLDLISLAVGFMM